MRRFFERLLALGFSLVLLGIVALAILIWI